MATIDQLYEQYFGRSPDAEGAAYWAQQAASGQDVAKAIGDIAAQYAASTPQQAAQTWDSGYTSQGYTPAQTAQAISTADPYTAPSGYTTASIADPLVAAGNYSVYDGSQATGNALTDYVRNNLYGKILGRDPMATGDQAGLNYWVSEATRNGWNNDQLAKEFANSAGTVLTQSAQSDAQRRALAPQLWNDVVGGQVRDLYGQIGRTGEKAPTQDEINYWINQNLSGQSLQDAFLKAASGTKDPKYAANAQSAQNLLNASRANLPAVSQYTSTYQDAPTYQSQPFNFEADPSYAFRKSEGEKALQSKQLASGNFFSGNALKEAADYNSGLASQEYGNAFNRYLQNDQVGFRNNQTAYDRNWNSEMRDYNRWTDNYNRTTAADDTNWNRLAYLDQSGQNAATQTANSGMNAASNVSNLQTRAGDAQAGGYINSANSWTNAIGNALYGMRKY